MAEHHERCTVESQGPSAVMTAGVGGTRDMDGGRLGESAGEPPRPFIWLVSAGVGDRGNDRMAHMPSESPGSRWPHLTGDDGFLLRVPLFYSGRARTSRPGAAPPRTAAADARPPTVPVRCPGPRTPHGSI